MALVRLAIRKGWPVPPAVRRQILAGLYGSIEGRTTRHSLAAAKTIVAVDFAYSGPCDPPAVASVTRICAELREHRGRRPRN
jgi:hypothetical protein